MLDHKLVELEMTAPHNQWSYPQQKFVEFARNEIGKMLKITAAD